LIFRHVELKNLFLFCVKVFALETVVVASATSDFEDFVEASAVTKNHSALSTAFHSQRLESDFVKAFRLLSLKFEQARNLTPGADLSRILYLCWAYLQIGFEMQTFISIMPKVRERACAERGQEIRANIQISASQMRLFREDNGRNLEMVHLPIEEVTSELLT
jgi:hypothetical protein